MGGGSGAIDFFVTTEYIFLSGGAFCGVLFEWSAGDRVAGSRDGGRPADLHAPGAAGLAGHDRVVWGSL